MDRYGGGEGREETQVGPEAEWSSPGGETRLEEPMWQLALGGGTESYPERPGEADCNYYLRTGFCGFGSRCRFNHPRDRGVAVGVRRASGWEYPERVSQPVCQYYMRTGMCKFGASCKYHHPRQGGGFPNQVALNVFGYPLQPGEKECSYYMKTGQCKFGETCRFHHPQPGDMQVPTSAAPLPFLAPSAMPSPAMYTSLQSPSVQSSEQYRVVTGNWPAARSAVLQGSYLPGTYGPMLLPPGMLPISGWSPYLTPLSPVASPSNQATAGAGPMYGTAQLSPSAAAYIGPYLSVPSSAGPSGSGQKEQIFPDRPGQPECQYYMKTGDCKFGSSCKYHHPPEWNAPKTNFTLSPMGLPLRPGAPLCSYYAQNGVCKFGPSCRFDHPMEGLSYSPSASSLADMPVAPYPVGSSIGTLAPSSSSSDSRPELISASNKDTSARMSSSMISSRGSVGSIFSATGDISNSTAQQSGQISTPSMDSGGAGYGGEVTQAEQKH